MTTYKDYIWAIEKGYWNGKYKYCIDITNMWFYKRNMKLNMPILYKLGEKFKYKGKEYYIDGHNIVMELKKEEIELAIKISRLTSKRIILFPRFNKPNNFKSADCKIGRQYFDFKITTSGSDRFLYNNVYESRHQSNNFLFWIKSKNISVDIINYQIDNTFRRIKSIKTIGYYYKGIFKIYKKREIEE